MTSINIQFSVSGAPRGKQRPRMVRRGRKTITYTPIETKNYERQIREGFLLSALRADLPLRGNLCIEVIALFPRTKSLEFCYKDGRYKHGVGRLLMGVKPDGDNIMKCVWDGIGEYIDGGDSRVVHGAITKMYCGIGELPRTFVRIWGVSNLEDLLGVINLDWACGTIDA